jgi:hypothetical protein
MSSSNLRGLAIRLAYARAKLHLDIEGGAHPYGLALVASRAEALGLRECRLEVAAPALFTDTPLLLNAWLRGRAHRISSVEAWQLHCAELHENALKAAGGGGYEWFLKLFSAQVDEALRQRVPWAMYAEMVEAARQFGYLNPSEREALDEELAEDGFCTHGIERDCCPAGCGEI